MFKQICVAMLSLALCVVSLSLAAPGVAGQVRAQERPASPGPASPGSPAAPVEKIDRRALVTRHNVSLRHIDPTSPLMVGNGNLAFTADITGLQTFPEQYSPIAPLLTEAQWGWHSFPDPAHYRYEDSLVPVQVHGATQYYPWLHDW
jgi:hypothetical protein